jgi:hypothetical protein
MKKVLCFVGVFAMLAGSSWAKSTVKPVVKPAPAQVQSMIAEPNPAEQMSDAALIAPESQILPPSQKVDEMTPGLSYNFLMDVKMFSITDPTFVVPTTASSTTDWFFYTTYRGIASYVFNNGLAILADIEKPGFADITVPTLKVNEFFAKYKEGVFYTKVGRQTFGDTDDLLLGMQNDAVTVGWELANVDLPIFIAKTAQIAPWELAGFNTDLAGMFGFIPTFHFGSTMGLKAYLLDNTQKSTATPAGGVPKDVINSLLTIGAKYFMNLPVGAAGQIDLGAQLGIENAMAVDTADESIDDTGLGMKLDGAYSHRPASGFGFKAAAHIVYTSGRDYTPLASTPAGKVKYGFVSNNELTGSGPGLFSKIQDAGAFAYQDTHGDSQMFQQYAGVFAAGESFQGFAGPVEFGVGDWVYSDTNKYPTNAGPNPALGGVEIDEWITFRVSKALSFYQQLGYFMPDNLSPAIDGETVKSPIKFLVGTTILL